MDISLRRRKIKVGDLEGVVLLTSLLELLDGEICFDEFVGFVIAKRFWLEFVADDSWFSRVDDDDAGWE